MSDPLETARATPLGPYVPATKVMLLGWCGPIEYLCRPLDTHPNDSLEGWEETTILGGWIRHPDRGTNFRSEDPSRVRLDTRRHEVCDRLVRLDLLPHALRDHPGAAVAAGLGVGVSCALPPWCPVDHPAAPWERGATWQPHIAYAEVFRGGWHILIGGQYAARGASDEVPGLAGRLAADLAALRLGCVLEEVDGWYVPLPDGGVGFVKKESP